jgi:hypothetical protein
MKFDHGVIQQSLEIHGLIVDPLLRNASSAHTRTKGDPSTGFSIVPLVHNHPQLRYTYRWLILGKRFRKSRLGKISRQR